MKLTANGNYKITTNLSGIASGVYILYVSGATGTATAILTYKDEDEVYVPLVDGQLAVGEQYTVHTGLHLDLYVTVTGADGATAINVMARGKV